MDFKKRLLFFSLAVILLVSVPFNVAEARSPERNIKIWVNDFYIMSDVHPFVENSRTFIPIRFIAEELGYKVDWNEKTEIVSIEANGTKMLLRIGSSEVDVNGEIMYLDAPARLREGRTFVPFRMIAELFGQEVEYDSEHKIAIIGNEYDADEYYPLKYYLNNNNPFITVFKVNFFEYIVKYYDGRQVNLESDAQILKLVDEEGKIHKELEFDREVEVDKQLYDKYYVAPVESDAFLGSWHGITKTSGTTEYYDQYVYIEKVEDNKYLLTSRSIKPNGSELITESYASYDEVNQIFKKEKSYKTKEATGDFTHKWYTTKLDYKVENFDYIYNINDSKMFLRKY